MNRKEIKDIEEMMKARDNEGYPKDCNLDNIEEITKENKNG